jgi:hypothetical protein
VTSTAIAAVVPRRRTTLEGRVVSVSPRFRPWVRLDVVLGDESGTVTLRFVGRDGVPGMRVGRQIRVEGTPAIVRGTLIVLNPLYEFIPDTCRPH